MDNSTLDLASCLDDAAVVLAGHLAIIQELLNSLIITISSHMVATDRDWVLLELQHSNMSVLNIKNLTMDSRLKCMFGECHS